VDYLDSLRLSAHKGQLRGVATRGQEQNDAGEVLRGWRASQAHVLLLGLRQPI